MAMMVVMCLLIPDKLKWMLANMHTALFRVCVAHAHAYAFAHACEVAYRSAAETEIPKNASDPPKDTTGAPQGQPWTQGQQFIAFINGIHKLFMAFLNHLRH